MKKRFTEEQIIGILKEAEAGLKPAELCRKYGISEATYYNWKARFGGMTVSEARRLKELNNKLKRLLAESMLNERPRKTLNFDTPAERFHQACCIDRLNPPSLRVVRVAAEPPFTVACSSGHRDRRSSDMEPYHYSVTVSSNSGVAQRVTATTGAGRLRAPISMHYAPCGRNAANDLPGPADRIVGMSDLWASRQALTFLAQRPCQATQFVQQFDGGRG